ncbi:VOC family protein [Candidatus Thiothrix sp. Deng01]|uniref:VOC family protein n=1 Tax=Candidatus Thiothrix phosphatis TaxID=3112415 RepID=A0ABU6CWX4_9GAMM|nr:VOC family protein [Candidatus Thiothrix sp. Deng01]MEB4591331.1 VOC family protein [Candidatus Thiothrix sp. Deng01]
MKPNPVGWFEIYVQDMARAQAFYESVFQTTLDQLPPSASSEGQEYAGGMQMLLFPMTQDNYGAAGALVQMDGVPSGGNSTLVYFSCEDCAVEAARAADSGGRIFKEKFPIGEHGHIALVFDTEGNMIGLHSMK